MVIDCEYKSILKLIFDISKKNERQRQNKLNVMGTGNQFLLDIVN